jgi:hypothetical protein
LKEIWVLITGSRDVRDREWATAKARSLLEDLWIEYGRGQVHVIHGDAEGIDKIFAAVCEEFGIEHEPWPAKLFPHPFIRNQFMVNLVKNAADVTPNAEAVCWAFARKWASGTGNCARKAREAGIKVIDFGVNTGVV